MLAMAFIFKDREQNMSLQPALNGAKLTDCKRASRQTVVVVVVVEMN